MRIADDHQLETVNETQDVLGEELVFWKTVAAVRYQNGALH